MKIKTRGLDGLALDWAVTSIEEPDALRYGVQDWREQRRNVVTTNAEFVYRWHQSWAQGGPIIERECICVDYIHRGRWLAVKRNTDDAYADASEMIAGPTPLIAAMRCLCASRLGDEVDVPDELV